VCLHRSGLVAKSNESRYLEAVHHAMAAWQLLNYHAALARTSSKPGDQLIEGLGLLDVMMADNLECIVSREALS
jgi:erythromycin esterase